MFDDIFLCDSLNGHSLYDGDYEEDYPSECINPVNPRYNDGPEKTYIIYGVLQRKTDKAGLYKLIRVKDHKYILDIEKWLPYSQVLAENIQDFDQKETFFRTEFEVTGYQNIDRIELPGWLFKTMFGCTPKTQVYFNYKIK